MIHGSAWRLWSLPLAIAAILCACGMQKEAAQEALAETEHAVSSLRSDAASVAPDELAALDESLAGLKADLARQDYRAVVSGAPVLMARVGALQQRIIAKKAEQAARAARLTESWNALVAEVPDLVNAVNARVDSLAHTSKLLAGMDRTAFEATRAAAIEMTQSWQQALGAFANDNMEEAVGSAEAAKQKGAEVMTRLGMEPNT
jgi:hypothetical protein